MGRDETKASTGKRGTWEPTVYRCWGKSIFRLLGKPSLVSAVDPLLWLVPRHHHLGKLLGAGGLQTCPLHSLLAAAPGTLKLGPEILQIARQAV